jgi:D-glycero-D-manno-heptose 1,7-bisphosphate phosphatase
VHSGRIIPKNPATLAKGFFTGPETKVMRPGVFLDRDGTLNVDSGYTYRWEDFHWIPGAIEALELLRDAKLFVVIVSNQAGVARGLYKESDILSLYRRIAKDLNDKEIPAPPFYYCPHHPDYCGPCSCRKPKTGMLKQAAEDYNLDLSRSFMVGDKRSDLQAGLSAGCRTLHVRTGYGNRGGPPPKGVTVADDILAAVRIILSETAQAART